MPKYQACPKCAAQFDVSNFAPGQKFTCGACGTVVTAGAPSAPAVSRTPGAPAVAGRAPGSRGPAGSPPGPQYRPLDRSGKSSSRAPAPAEPAGRGGRRGRGRETEVSARPARSKSNTPLIAGAVGLLVVAGVVAAVVLGGKDDDGKPDGGGGSSVARTNPGSPGGMGAPNAGGGAAAAVTKESLADVEGDYKQKSAHSTKELVEFLRRYKSIENERAKERAKEVAQEIVAVAPPTEKAAITEARETLGHLRFANEIPEEITYYNEPFIRAVQDANAQQWFSDKEQYDLAMKAWRKTVAHAKRLAEDRVYAALTQEKSRISRDADFKDYKYTTHFASPYLIFYSSKDEMSEFDLMKMSRAERAKELAEMEERRKEWSLVLAEKGKIYSQLYQHFMKTYGEECDLKDLMQPYGGRPDYPPSKRSFAEGVPLVIWIFDSREAFDYHHNKVQKDGASGLENVAGYFSPQTGWVYLYDEADRHFEINKNVHEGTHQLQHWFTRQKNEWATDFRVPQSFFGEGFAEYVGSVQMDEQRNLKFIGVNRPRLRAWQDILKRAERDSKKPPIFPLEALVGFEGYGQAAEYARDKLNLPAVGLPPDAGLHVFYIQSWALVYFLNDHANQKYRKSFHAFLNDMLVYEDDEERFGYEAFKRAFKIKTESDWKALDTEFRNFYTKDLKAIQISSLGEEPPGKGHWPGFVEPDEDATDPEAASASTTEKGG
jgi:hypothetical protein